jgi:putative tricarboxylic transport membrane protein
METLNHILNGFAVALQPINLWYTLVGCFLGTVVGVLPGIGPAASIALLIPVTYGMNPGSALIMLAGIYYGAKYGGSTTAILIRTPGETSSVMTCIEGYAMALKGRAGAALAVSAIGSFIAGTIGVIGLTLFAVPLASMAIEFGPAEFFTLMLFAMTAVASLTGRSLPKGLFSMFLGLMLGTVGIDLQSAYPRYTMGVLELQEGISFVVVAVGLFAVAEVLQGLEMLVRGTAPDVIRISGKLWLTREEWRRSIGPIWRGGILGFIIGVIPGAGSTIASILSYNMEKSLSKHPEEFGEGAIEGVAGPEAANNSDTAGALVPLLTLGLPGGAVTAVMMGAFIMYGIQPGPQLFKDHPEVVWGLINSMYVGNIMLLILNLPLIGLFVRLLYIPRAMLYPLIVAIAVIGIYSVNGSVVDLYMLLFFGVAGYLFSKADIPITPLVLGLVLGDLLEQSFRQAMTLSDGSLGIFFGSRITVTLTLLTVLSLLWPLVASKMRALKG